MKILKIYTDGGLSLPNSIGAAAFVIIDKKNKVITESVITYHEKEELDNNKYELLAIINALNWLRSNGYSPKQYRIYVNTDHQPTQLGLCVNLPLWRKDNWKHDIQFKVLWKYIDMIIRTEFKSIHIQWLPKSAQNIWHKRAHELCTIAMKNFKKSKIEVNGTL